MPANRLENFINTIMKKNLTLLQTLSVQDGLKHLNQVLDSEAILIALDDATARLRPTDKAIPRVLFSCSAFAWVSVHVETGSPCQVPAS